MRAKGQVQFNKWKEGKKLTKSEAILALCYDCTGRYADGPRDCETPCPIRDSGFMPYGPKVAKSKSKRQAPAALLEYHKRKKSATS